MLLVVLVVLVVVVTSEKQGTKANMVDQRMLLDYRCVWVWVGVGGSKAGVRKVQKINGSAACVWAVARYRVPVRDRERRREGSTQPDECLAPSLDISLPSRQRW